MSKDDVPRMKTEIPGPKAQEILERQSKYLFYKLPTPLPIVWEKAQGAVVTDVDGNRYIDLSSGVLVMNVGHSHPVIIDRIMNQVQQLIHSYFAPTSAQVDALEALASMLPQSLQRIMLVTTGAESVEAAVKIARAFTKKTEILTFFGSFHGRSYLTMGMGGLMGVKKDFGPMPTGHLHAPYAYCYRCSFGLELKSCGMQCLKFLDELLETSSKGDPAAVVVEPYQGSSGAVVPPPQFLEGLREFCDRNDMLLIFDEVQAGMGRTGKNFAFEHFSFLPDIVCLGKGIASGIPTSAVIVRNDISDALRSLSWTSTFAANPLSSAAIAASVEILVEENLSAKAARTSEHMLERMNEMKLRYPLIGDVRGMGMSMGMEFVLNQETKEPAPKEAMEIFMNATRGGLILIPPVGINANVLRLGPPLNLPDDLTDKALDIIEDAVHVVSQG